MDMANSTMLTKSIDATFLKEVDKSSTMHSSGMSIIGERQNSSFFQSKISNKNKTSAMTARKRIKDTGHATSTDRNSLYDTYFKMKSLKHQGVKERVKPLAKPSLRN